MKKNGIHGLFFIFLLFFTFGCAHSQLHPNNKKFGVNDNLDKWMKRYYKSPEPELFYAGFDEFNQTVKDPNLNPLAINFFGEIVKNNPNLASDWAKQIGTWSLSENSKHVFQEIIKYSNFSGEKIMSVETAQDLDSLWGRFFATGNKKNMLAIVSSLKWVPDGPDDKKQTYTQSQVGMAARWSLKANAKTNLDIRDSLQEILKTSDSSKIKKVLAQVIEDSKK